ncbi:FxSxx-COOH system tetratricopeptide repeat protein [Streptacidiphilus sp. N1-12]|uniref:FxSxx-COOH system tetratricopeptide repeat protein n=2 Tax=Streptacidiphilus alkalitolerans TaxID=3342712 RepID=A0ABV6V2K8_9ACTN
MDFFVSHAGADRAWAEWVAWQLREAGYQVELDFWDWAAGDNFILKMNDALAGDARMVALFSPAYFERTRFTTEEWAAVLAAKQKMVPVRIDAVSPAATPPLLRALLAPSLYGLDEPAAAAELLRAVRGPAAPATAPAFPGTTTPSAGSGGARPRFPSSTGTPEVWNVRLRNPRFTGREETVTHIRDGLLGGGHVQAWHGLGGIGKSQIAVEYAHRFASQYDLVWWIDAEQADQLPVHYTELAARLEIDKPEAGADQNARMLLGHLRTRERWLIILDNAENPETIEPWLPGGPGHVLITSRNPAWGTLVPSIGLDVFTRAESLAYLTTCLPTLAPGQADALAESLGDLPLALAQAAGVLNSGMSAERYQHLLTTKTGQILALGSAQGYPAPLGASVDIATARLTDENPGALALLRLGAFLGPEPIPTAWLEAARPQLSTIPGDPDDLMWPHAALQPLARYGLARVDHTAFQIHRLTQAVLSDQTNADDAAAIQADALALLETVQPEDPKLPASWPAWAALNAHLAAQGPVAAETSALRGTLLNTVRYLIHSGQPQAAHDLADALHRAWSGTAGTDDPDALTAAQYIGHATSDLGDFTSAHAVIEDTFERRCRVLGVDHPDTLHSANDLAVILSQLGTNAEGRRRMHEETLARRRRILGVDHPDTLHSAYGLASAVHSIGGYAEARRMDEDTLARRRRVLGEDHPDTLHSAYNLASTMYSLGLYAEVYRIHEDTLARRRRVLGVDHPDTLRSAHGLASTVHSLGDYAEARRMDEDTLARRRRVLGEDHPDTLRSAHGLASTVHSLGDHAGARRMAEDTLARLRRVLGEDHPDTLRSAHGLAATVHRLGDHAEARRMAEDTLARRRRVLGEDHPDTLDSVHGLAITLGSLGKHRAAAQLLKDARTRMRRSLGDDHPRTKGVTEDLAHALIASGQPFEAQKLLAPRKPAGGKKGKSSKKRR